MSCTGTTRKGKPCGAYPLKGTTKCLAHSDAQTRASVGFIAANGKGGRPPAPRAVDVLRERVEARIDEVIAPLFDALGAAGGFTVKFAGEDGEEQVAFVPEPDHGIRLQAVRELLDRVYGKPKQTQELTGANGGPVELVTPEDATQRAEQAALILQRARLTVGNGNNN